MRFGVFSFISLAILGLSSCEKCMKCSYTYTVTTIQQTVNGEQEVVTSYTGYATSGDTIYDDECVKSGESFTIEQYYLDKQDTTVLDDFAYTCVEL